MGDYDEALDTIRLLKQMPRPFVLHIYSMTLFPGTALYKRALKKGVLTEDQIEDRVYRSVIPRNVKLSESPSHGLPVILYDIGCKGSESYLELAREFLCAYS